MFFISTRSSLKIACFSNLTESLAMHIKRFKKKRKKSGLSTLPYCDNATHSSASN